MGDRRADVLMRLFYAFNAFANPAQLCAYADICKAIEVSDLQRGVDKLIAVGGKRMPTAPELRVACVGEMRSPPDRRARPAQPSPFISHLFRSFAEGHPVSARCDSCDGWFETDTGYLTVLAGCGESGEGARVLCHATCASAHLRAVTNDVLAREAWAWPVLVAINRDNHVPTPDEVTDLDRLGYRGERVSRMRRAGMFSGRRAER